MTISRDRNESVNTDEVKFIAIDGIKYALTP